MPIYEYQCKACGQRLEKLQKISAAPLVECPACDAPALERLVSAAGFRLAGGGWYETDFKSSGTKRNLAGEGGSTSSSGSDKASST
ncbi:FmdB family zinc ribbon protein [Larsenimonas rhizosphaerae]|uniref:Zinc ribbon domain-containing protein n=1 Tax=Larsenimonas rhizosphaerae TaxID=2944682 RepID=A0AA42CX23_9GAMM|nr:zinc ribbon domain-containing protein [Larsenimonas rhizosphaerae]MCM2130666.1 zinc ribbon domain-containing protein [Larsenimonas rhizosphaerae]MCX2523370.1 zinc ribbon domain-containing protein [Larsenimonas rhizosphaerae]